MVSDKIFVTVFTAFIAVITTASVVVAHLPMDAQDGASALEVLPRQGDALKPKKFEVVSAEDLLGGNVVTPATPVADDIKHTVDVVVDEPVKPSFVVLQAADLEEMLKRAITAGTAAGIKAGLSKPPVPTWKKVLSWTWFGVKLPYQALMLVPAEIRVLTMLYFILKFKPEIFGWGVKEVLKRSPGFGKTLFSEFGIPMAEEMSHVIVDGIKANVAEFLPTRVMGGMANTSTAAAEMAAGLANTWMPEWIQNTALAWKF